MFFCTMFPILPSFYLPSFRKHTCQTENLPENFNIICSPNSTFLDPHGGEGGHSDPTHMRAVAGRMAPPRAVLCQPPLCKVSTT